MSGYASGGMVCVVTSEGLCASGHRLVKIDNGPIEHFVTPDEIRRGDFSAMTCRSLG